MEDFSRLIENLDSTTSTNQKVKFLVQYFDSASDRDIVWTVALLTGRRPKRSVNTTLVRELAATESGIPLWLFEESYHVVGDLAETISLVIPSKESDNQSLDHWIRYLVDLKEKDDESKSAHILLAWRKMDQTQKFVFTKLITGGFRIGVSQKLIIKALSKYSQIEENVLAHQLMGEWDPFTVELSDLLNPDMEKVLDSRPYPFYLAYALEEEVSSLGDPNEWLIERKWDGIRGQIIVRNDKLFVWSRGEELITDKFPEFFDLVNVLENGTVLDGEILAYNQGKPLDFQVLQTRIGRKSVSKKILTSAPVAFIAYDILEYKGTDIRDRNMMERRRILEEMIPTLDHNRVHLSEKVKFNSWEDVADERNKSVQHRCEGLMLKHAKGVYKTGRKRGEWWKWKIDPFTIDAVLIYAMRGHGRRANLYTDYTFAVWDDDVLVPFTKAYSGLTDEEFRSVDAFVKRNTIERFGPVRSVKPELVFEIAFEGIALSTRHKSGVALRFPRMSRWRKDKKPVEANTKNDLMNLINLRNVNK